VCDLLQESQKSDEKSDSILQFEGGSNSDARGESEFGYMDIYLNRRILVNKIRIFVGGESGSAGESHPHAPTDRYVTVSRHTAPASHSLETSRSQADAERNPVPPSCLVDPHLLQAGSSPSLRPHYRAFNTNTG
jgi:hypothetical protein